MIKESNGFYQSYKLTHCSSQGKNKIYIYDCSDRGSLLTKKEFMDFSNETKSEQEDLISNINL